MAPTSCINTGTHQGKDTYSGGTHASSSNVPRDTRDTDPALQRRRDLICTNMDCIYRACSPYIPMFGIVAADHLFRMANYSTLGQSARDTQVNVPGTRFYFNHGISQPHTDRKDDPNIPATVLPHSSLGSAPYEETSRENLQDSFNRMKMDGDVICKSKAKSWKGGNLVLWSVSMQLDLHPGDLIQFLGRRIYHGNTPLGGQTSRNSLVFFTDKALTDCLHKIADRTPKGKTFEFVINQNTNHTKSLRQKQNVQK